jgi:hypothetical protein
LEVARNTWRATDSLRAQLEDEAFYFGRRSPRKKDKEKMPEWRDLVNIKLKKKSNLKMIYFS